MQLCKLALRTNRKPRSMTSEQTKLGHIHTDEFSFVGLRDLANRNTPFNLKDFWRHWIYNLTPEDENERDSMTWSCSGHTSSALTSTFWTFSRGFSCYNQIAWNQLEIIKMQFKSQKSNLKFSSFLKQLRIREIIVVTLID